LSTPIGNENCLVEIPFRLDNASLLKRLRLPKTDGLQEAMVLKLLERARAIARLRALYWVSNARVIDRNSVEIGGTRFTSRALSKNLINQDKVFPFIATVGKELDEFSDPSGNMMMKFCLDVIKTLALVSAVDYLAETLKEKYRLADVALMNPGEIEDWPITAQKPLFALFEGGQARVGVTLTGGGLMRPIKSRSGIVFSTDKPFVSCFLCTQQRCPGRRSPYSPEKVKEYLE
jgi:hypothetical protein